MKAVKPWVKALEIDAGQFQSWLAEVPKHENVTFWCLESGRIRSSDYFGWAVNHYGLAVLSPDYFRQPPNRELWGTIQNVANWGPELLPLEQWDGIVFVGCVEPPEDIRWSFPVRYVLARAQDLRNHWDRLNDGPTRITTSPHDLRHLDEAEAVQPLADLASADDSVEVVEPDGAPAATIPAAPAASAADAPQATAAAPSGGFKVQLNIPGVASSPPPAKPEALLEQSTSSHSLAMPEGLSLNLGGTLKVTEVEEAIEPKTAITGTLDVPEGLNLAPSTTVPHPKPTTPPPGLAIKLESVKLGAGPTPPPPPPEAQPVATTTQAVLINAPPPSAKNTTGAVDSDALAPASLSEAHSELEVVAWAFQQLKQHFKYFWLLFHQGESLIPYRWDAGLCPTDSAATSAIDLSQPSLFRIVARTRMPYHGHVVEGPINSLFFRRWGLRSTPPHVTAVPLVTGDHVVAVLLAAGEKPAQSDQVLRFTEKIGMAMTNNIGKKEAA